MSKEKETVKQQLIAKIKEKHFDTTGEEVSISGDTRPFKDLSYFDSLIASEVGIELEEVLTYEFPTLKKAFEEADIEGRTIDEMCDIIMKNEK